MKQKRVYVGTSIAGGFFDTEVEKETKLLFNGFENKDAVFVVSTMSGKKEII